MDQHSFDALVRRLGATLSRRTALGAGLLALGPLTLAGGEPAAARSKKKRQKCGPCERRKGRKRCKPKPDNTACRGEGRCRRGKCRQPTCTGNLACATSADCCSGSCDLGAVYCDSSAPGQPCRVDTDCLDSAIGARCVGYICKAPSA